jgi:hypothetical protein
VGSIDACDFLHEAIYSDGDSIDGEGTHEANEVPPIEGPPSVLFELFAEALRHRLVLEVAQLVRLHQCLHVVEGIVKDPVGSTTETTGDQGHVDRNIVLVSVGRSQLARDVFDDCEIDAEPSALTDCGGSLSSEEPPNTVLFEDLGSSIDRTCVYVISMATLDLDADSRVFDRTLC